MDSDSVQGRARQNLLYTGDKDHWYLRGVCFDRRSHLTAEHLEWFFHLQRRAYQWSQSACLLPFRPFG